MDKSKEVLTGVFTLVGVAIGATLTFLFSLLTQGQLIQAQNSQLEKDRFISYVSDFMMDFETWDDYTAHILHDRITKDTTALERFGSDQLFTWSTRLMNNTNKIVLISDEDYAKETIMMRDIMMQSMDSCLTSSNFPIEKRLELRDTTGARFEKWINKSRSIIRKYNEKTLIEK